MRPDRSVIALIGILQDHGLTVDALEDWVALCQRRSTGSVLFDIREGQIETYDERRKRRLRQPTEKTLTKA